MNNLDNYFYTCPTCRTTGIVLEFKEKVLVGHHFCYCAYGQLHKDRQIQADNESKFKAEVEEADGKK